MLGSRAIEHDGWKAVTDHVPEGAIGERQLVEGSTDFDTDRWSLFHVAEDFAEAEDLAEREPGRLAALVERWWFEAGRNQVLPLSDTLVGRVPAMAPGPPAPTGPRVLRPGGGPVADDVAPLLAGGFELTAHVEVPDTGVEGILCAQGDWINGWALLVRDGVLSFVVNAYGTPVRVTADRHVAPGTTRLGCRYVHGAAPGGGITLFVDGEPAGSGTLPGDLPFRWQIGGAGLRVGEDAGFPVCDDYAPPFRWTGGLDRVVFDDPGRRPEPGLEEVLRHE